MRVRRYTKDDYATICGWWEARSLPAPREDQLPLSSTFVVESGATPIAALTLLRIVDVDSIAIAENFIADPSVAHETRRAATTTLAVEVERFARACGVERLMGMPEQERLVERYKEWGYQAAVTDVTVVMKELGRH